MPPLLHRLMSRLQAPAGDAGADSSGTGPGDLANLIPMGEVEDGADDGSGFEPTDDDAVEEKKPAPKKPAAKAEPKAEPKGKAEAEDDEPEVDPEDPDGEQKPAKKDSRIPLSRHTEVLAKERAKREAVERELAASRQGRVVAATNANITEKEDKILGLEAEYNQLLADGDVAKATAKMRELRQLDRDVSEMKSDMKIAAAEARATETTRYSITLERIEAAYPQLNEDHDDYNEEMVADVLDLKAAYVARRNMTAAAALQAAVEKLLGKKTAKQEAAVEVTARVPKEDEEKTPGKEVTDQRKADAVKKAVSAANKTPPDTGKQGRDSDAHGSGAYSAKDIMKMTDEEMMKLPDHVLAAARGDDL